MVRARRPTTPLPRPRSRAQRGGGEAGDLPDIWPQFGDALKGCYARVAPPTGPIPDAVRHGVGGVAHRRIDSGVGLSFFVTA